jgi:hypothetical protein
VVDYGTAMADRCQRRSWRSGGYATTPQDDFFGPEFGAAVFGTLGGALGLLVGTGLAIG